MKDLYTLVDAKEQPYEPTDSLDRPDDARSSFFVVYTNIDDALEVAAKALKEGVIVGLRKVSDVL
jgi:hypothetical protein